MLKNAAECSRADLAFADVCVAIYTATEGNLGIVDVEDRNVVKADGLVNVLDGLAEPFFGTDVVARSKEVRSIEANTGVQFGEAREDVGHFFKRRTNGRAHARGVLHQNPQISHRDTLCGLLNAFDYGSDRIPRGTFP